VLREGDVFGEMALLSRKAASASVVARRNTLVLRLPRPDCDELISTHPTVLEVLSELAERREREQDEIISGAKMPPPEVLAIA